MFFLGACRTLGVESEDAAQRGQFLPDSPPHSGAMGQETGEKWAAAAHLQPTIPKSDRLLDPSCRSRRVEPGGKGGVGCARGAHHAFYEGALSYSRFIREIGY